MLTAKDDKEFPVAPVKQESSFPPSAANVREDLPMPRAESAALLRLQRQFGRRGNESVFQFHHFFLKRDEWNGRRTILVGHDGPNRQHE
jgi:hypothetical protein